MESALYGIYARVVFVSEILLVRCAHSFDFWYVNNSCVNTVRQHFPWSILYFSKPCIPESIKTINLFAQKFELFHLISKHSLNINFLCISFKNYQWIWERYLSNSSFISVFIMQDQISFFLYFCTFELVEYLLRGFSKENFGDRDGNYFPIVHGHTQDVKLFWVSTKNVFYGAFWRCLVGSLSKDNSDGNEYSNTSIGLD